MVWMQVEGYRIGFLAELIELDDACEKKLFILHGSGCLDFTLQTFQDEVLEMQFLEKDYLLLHELEA